VDGRGTNATVARGYADPGYANSLHEFGSPLRLPASGGSVLERAISGTSDHDLMGPYPLFACPRWEALADDLHQLEGSAVSVMLVADPLAEVGQGELRRAFRDHVIPFKRHQVRDLEAPAGLPAHHRRHIRRAARSVEVELCADPLLHLDDWTRLYAGLAARHGLAGIRAFSRAAFTRQLGLPGLVALRAERHGKTVGMALWLEDAPSAYYHLGAYVAEGYEVSASYALFALALEHLRSAGVRRVDLGGAAGVSALDDGLVRFKRGWANEERTAYLCGRVLDRAGYERLVEGPPGARSDWFPAYRAAERDLAGG
jgi:Acetyltransferase (GNAT) domain